MLKKVISFLAQLWRSHLSLAVLFLLGISLNWAIAACNNTPPPTSYASPAASPAATPAQAVAAWADANPEEVVKILAPILNVDVSILDEVTRRRSYGFEAMQADMVAEQQEIADTFLNLA